MSVANLVLEYLKILVWPLTVGGVLIGYRRALHRLLARVIQVDAAGVSATFDKATQEAAEITGSTVDAPSSLEKKAALQSSFRIKPRSYIDARSIGHEYRAGKAVLLDVTDLEDADARRLIDFSAGLVFQAGAQLDRIANRVFLLEPSDGSQA